MNRMLRKLCCRLIGHRYRVVQEFSSHSRRVVCDHCGADWGMNDQTRTMIPWDEELAEIYRMFGHRIIKP